MCFCVCSIRPIRCKARSRTHWFALRAWGGCYLNAIVLSEFAWTLARGYKESREVIAAHLASLLAAPEFVVGHSEEASRALGRYLSGRADFPDYFLAEINKTAGCPYTSTFDVDALKSGDPFSGVPALR
jgi:predicted nucleic-acid-binding protein